MTGKKGRVERMWRALLCVLRGIAVVCSSRAVAASKSAAAPRCGVHVQGNADLLLSLAHNAFSAADAVFPAVSECLSAGNSSSPRGRWAAVALVAAAACVSAVLFASQVDRPAVLQSCTPCTSGPGCVAGCMSMEASQARMQELVETTKHAQLAAQSGAVHTSLHEQESSIQNRNEALLQMGKGHSEALGGVLDAAVKQVLRAEAAEVKLRRQAALSKGASVGSVYQGLRCVSRA